MIKDPRERESVAIYVYYGSPIRVNEVPGRMRETLDKRTRAFNLIFENTVSDIGPKLRSPERVVVSLSDQQADSLLDKLTEKVHGKTFEDLTDEIDRLLEEVKKLNRELDGVAERGRHNVFNREL